MTVVLMMILLNNLSKNKIITLNKILLEDLINYMLAELISYSEQIRKN